MPRYDFQCANCGVTFEVRMSMSEYSESSSPECPECGSGDTERSFSAVGVMVGSRGSSGRSSSMSGGCGPSGFT